MSRSNNVPGTVGALISRKRRIPNFLTTARSASSSESVRKIIVRTHRNVARRDPYYPYDRSLQLSATVSSLRSFTPFPCTPFILFPDVDAEEKLTFKVVALAWMDVRNKRTPRCTVGEGRRGGEREGGRGEGCDREGCGESYRELLSMRDCKRRRMFGLFDFDRISMLLYVWEVLPALRWSCRNDLIRNHADTIVRSICISIVYIYIYVYIPR